jgi:hypothetical protein
MVPFGPFPVQYSLFIDFFKNSWALAAICCFLYDLLRGIKFDKS